MAAKLRPPLWPGHPAHAGPGPGGEAVCPSGPQCRSLGGRRLGSSRVPSTHHTPADKARLPHAALSLIVTGFPPRWLRLILLMDRQGGLGLGGDACRSQAQSPGQPAAPTRAPWAPGASHTSARLWVPGSSGDAATPAGSSPAGPRGAQHGARAWSRGPAPHCLVPVRHRGWPLGDSEAPRCERHLAPGGRAWAWSCQASKGSHGNRGAGSSKPRGGSPRVDGCWVLT